MSQSSPSSAELKRLTGKRDRLRREIRRLPEGSRDRLRMEAELAGVERKLERVHGGAVVVVSEHAMVRFVQRKFNITEQELADMVLPPAAAAAIVKSGLHLSEDGCQEYPVTDEHGQVTHRVVLKGATVTTVVDAASTALKSAVRSLDGLGRGSRGGWGPRTANGAAGEAGGGGEHG